MPARDGPLLSEAVVFGGYGTFGSHVCRELARRGTRVTVAGRRREEAEGFARELGEGHRGLASDAGDPASCRAALAGQAVAVLCAGPFSRMGPSLLEACLEAGCHYVDISDDRRHATLVRGLGERFHERGLAAVYGCSSLPGLSGALALLAAERVGSGPPGERGAPPRKARVTLFIGNDNPKGEAAIASLLSGLGRPIAAPQGGLRGFCDGEAVALPAPFGRRTTYAFESPDYDLLPERLGVESVRVEVGFESRAATRLFAALACLGSGYGRGLARLLALLGGRWRGGSSGGVVRVELGWGDGTVRCAALAAGRDGQRLAALPAALAARALADGSATARGALTVSDLLGAQALVSALEAEGYAFERT